MGDTLKKSNNVEKFDIILVGYGIAARCLLREFAKSDYFSKKKILVVYNDDVFPPCSLNTTSIVCRSGVQKGISDLGDFIFDSYEEAISFYESHPECHEQGLQHSLTDQSPKGREDFIRRFGHCDSLNTLGDLSLSESFEGVSFKAYFIDPSKCLSALEQAYIEKLDVTIKKLTCREVLKKEGHLQLDCGCESFVTNKVIIASGAYSKFFQNNLKQESLTKSKFVSGSYIVFDDCDFGNKSFVLANRHYNLIYRRRSRQIMIGGSTVKEDLLCASVSELKSQYNFFRDLLKGDLVLPAFESGTIKTGLRHKGQKRRPFFGELEKGPFGNIYSMTGLYKNGFTFPFLGAKAISKLIQE
ncbi:FAD-dependent oxidoreductase [Halobacteriovorax sp. GB3]|uniref:FAD-dependent oxidoreductase n=1 Tax=Halobacteriovorax sp. GB3 TaxID=2719615 RepID=UPI00235DF34A|nr:FAD-dependent oxidoreductase [Halobacteriovorax sp. GB3]MDD0853038.1 FAD-dependent oxidoreductase [Halobacteriovorax sp. GB3]